MKIIKNLRIKYYRYKMRQIHKFMIGIYFPLDYMNSKEQRELNNKVQSLSKKVDFYRKQVKRLSAQY